MHPAEIVTAVYLLFFFLSGLSIGSFINVCVHRIPRDESVVRPPSHCPSCGKTIRWHDNIPVLSYIMLGARCRHCRTPISMQYPLIELLTGAAFAAVAFFFPGEAVLPVMLYFTFVLIAVSGIDYHYQIIPDVFSYSLIAVGLAGSVLNPHLGDTMGARAVHSALGTITGGGLLLLIGIAGEKVFGKEAMGGGDVKLMAGIGAVLGWSKVFSTLMIGSLFASVVGVFLIATKRIGRRDYVPFGPFLAAAAYLNLFLPDPISWLNSLYW